VATVIARECAPLFLAFTRCRSGGTAIEYALIAALLAVTLIAAINSAGQSLAATMGYVGSSMDAAKNGGSGGSGGGSALPGNGSNGNGQGNNGNGQGNGGPTGGGGGNNGNGNGNGNGGVGNGNGNGNIKPPKGG
jgi:Flp pilus assembly pilin Flp